MRTKYSLCVRQQVCGSCLKRVATLAALSTIFQPQAICGLTFWIFWEVGFKGWSLNFADDFRLLGWRTWKLIVSGFLGICLFVLEVNAVLDFRFSRPCISEVLRFGESWAAVFTSVCCLSSSLCWETYAEQLFNGSIRDLTVHPQSPYFTLYQ
jgi:hypothetical protein